MPISSPSLDLLGAEKAGGACSLLLVALRMLALGHCHVREQLSGRASSALPWQVDLGLNQGSS